MYSVDKKNLHPFLSCRCQNIRKMIQIIPAVLDSVCSMKTQETADFLLLLVCKN